MSANWRCEGCGAFLDECELIDGNGHELAEPFGHARLCGPVNKEKKHEEQDDQRTADRSRSE